MFTISSNYTEIATAETRNEAKAIAKAESEKYDDVVTVSRGGLYMYMASHGQLYQLQTTR